MTYTKDNIEFVPLPTIHNFKDLTGQVFTRLTVLGYAGIGSTPKMGSWFCECECGTITKVLGGNLRKGNTLSCGCLHKARTSEANTTHGFTGTPELDIYFGAKNRCTNPNDVGYKNYGGRGIEFRFTCFEELYEEVGDRPTPKHSLDRINNKTGHYEKGNVRWATKKQQGRNRRTNRLLTIGNDTRCVAEWAEIQQIHPDAIHVRLRRNWCHTCAVMQPLNGQGKCIHR